MQLLRGHFPQNCPTFRVPPTHHQQGTAAAPSAARCWTSSPPPKRWRHRRSIRRPSSLPVGRPASTAGRWCPVVVVGLVGVSTRGGAGGMSCQSYGVCVLGWVCWVRVGWGWLMGRSGCWGFFCLKQKDGVIWRVMEVWGKEDKMMIFWRFWLVGLRVLR